jgi:ApeA N-terminal domain 1
MKHFESSGLWFPGDDSANAVGGMLHYDSNGLNLKLLGSFREGWSTGQERYPTVRGVVDESPYGTFVTLLDCIRTRSRISAPGITSETIRCGRAVVGFSHLPDEPSRFETLEVSFSYLMDWVGQSGIKFQVTPNISYDIAYTDPDTLSFAFGTKIVSLAPWPKISRGMHHVSLDEETIIQIGPIGDQPLANLGGGLVQVLQNLLTFATDTPNGIEDLAYRGMENDQGIKPAYHLVFEPLFRLKTDKETLHSTDMLFTFADCQEHSPDIFQKWLNFTDKNPAFCTVYFANIYAEPPFLNDKFESLLQAFTLLSTSLGKVSERTKLFLNDVAEAVQSRYGQDEREMLGHIIPTGPEIEMPHHLLLLFQENADTLGALVEDIPRFVRSVSDTLAFFKRRSEGESPRFEGTDLLHATLKIRTLIKVLVLKEIGFGEKVVKSLVQRNSRINYLRTV